VAIVGAGPAGLLLGHLLRLEGVDAVVVERMPQAYVLGRIRAGVLERTLTDLLDRLGLGDRMRAEGLPHEAFVLSDGERLIRIDVADLTGQQVVVYGQTEVTRDLMQAATGRDLQVIYGAADLALHDVLTDAPYLTFVHDGVQHQLDARFICGCDGFHGPSRKAIPDAAADFYEKVYPFGWLGILADVPPCHAELIYASHPRGFALASMRSPTRSRYYVQVPLGEQVSDWPDDRLWDELAARLGPDVAARMTRGPAIEKSIAPLRSFVFETMRRHGSLFLAGDAAHIVPPTGAKGLNLAASDVAYLSEALAGFFNRRDNDAVAGYADKALARVWRAERFSWQLTRLMHRFPDADGFDRRMQEAELDYIAGSRAAQTSLAENYVGLPL
jgi:p-hydroxybenzoate 3-monooxygenase